MKPRLAAMLVAALLAGSCRGEGDLTGGGNPAGLVAFSAARFVADESAATTTVTLTRTGGSTGRVEVQVNCADDTARGGVDYDPCTGNAVWADGDSAPKTIAVTFTDDAAATGHKTLRLALSPVSANAAIGTPATAVLVIQDDDGSAPNVAFTNAFPALTFDAPVAVAAAPGDASRLYVVEQAGRIRVFANDAGADAMGTFLDISARVTDGGEAGLLGLAFDPDFASNGRFYVNYTTGDPLVTRISRFTASTRDIANAGSELILLSFAQPFTNHNGGWLGFGPDGKLYIASGDGGGGNDPQGNGQRLDTLLGKILRINSDGSIPGDNPFVNDNDASTLAPIWAYGLRNPWRGGFDRSTGDLWVGDVGQSAREEIDLIVAGGNYGWVICEGNVCSGPQPADYVAPVLDYDHGAGASVTGGYRYRGSAAPAAAGRYFYADFIGGQVWALQYNGAVQSNQQVTRVNFPSSFGEDLAGELYLVSYDGAVYRLFGF